MSFCGLPSGQKGTQVPRVFLKMSDPEQATSFIRTAVAPEEIAAIPYQTQNQPDVLIAEVPESEFESLAKSGATVYPDFKFKIFVPGDADRLLDIGKLEKPKPLMGAGKNLQDVLNHIRAPEAWRTSRGAGVTIAIVDTGVCPTLKEFPAVKRLSVDFPGSAYAGQNQWEDTEGHGSQNATIAAATRSAGGRFDGVAPDAKVISARSDLTAADVHIIYDQLISAKKQGRITGPLVISNSYDPGTCSAPEDLPEHHPYIISIVEAVKIGIPVVFAAGNNHWYLKCKKDPKACTPNTIWAANSLDVVMSVGTVDENNSNQDEATPHPNSSRGPGQWARSGTKPDCVAPTYGEVVWGCDYEERDWWGTSGACPQVAGLAALLLSANPALSPMQIYNIIRRTCKPLDAPAMCVGAGLIDCAAAVASAGHP
jgi:serine protease AprX